MLTVATALYRGEDVPRHSRGIFDPSWADKLYRGLARNLTVPWRMVLYTDQEGFEEDIDTRPFAMPNRNMFSLLETFREDLGRVLFMGLDTVIVGNIDDIAAYDGPFAMLRDPNRPKIGCSGVMGFPYTPHIWETFAQNPKLWARQYQMSGYPCDMFFLGRFEHRYLDDRPEYQGRMLSYKVHVKRTGLGDAGIVYFHGKEKPHEVYEDFVREHWV